MVQKVIGIMDWNRVKDCILLRFEMLLVACIFPPFLHGSQFQKALIVLEKQLKRDSEDASKNSRSS